MRFLDLHCDTAGKCFLQQKPLSQNDLHISLARAACFSQYVQLFAVWIPDEKRGEEAYRANMDWYLHEIGKCTYRKFNTGFFFGRPTQESQIYDNSTYISEAVYLGIADAADGGLISLEQRNKFCVGDEIEIMKPDGRDVPARVERILDENGEDMESAPHAKQRLRVRLSEPAEKYDLLRMRK